MQLRPFQKNALRLLAAPQIDLICIAPTGSGKSLIFQEYLRRNPESKALIFTPLVALQRQQEENLRHPYSRVLNPETLLYDRNRDLLTRWRPHLVVVDEAHCVWEWGQDFRPAFRRIAKWMEEAKVPKSLWLSATLPRQAAEEIRNSLPYRPWATHGEFAFPVGLHIELIQVPMYRRPERLAQLLEGLKGSGIIFVVTRAATDRIVGWLRAFGRPARAFHAGLASEEKESVTRDLKRGVETIVVATSAFGLGMDFSSLNWVILWQPPSSMLTWAQMLGRVARGGRLGRAFSFWNDDDFQLLEWMGKPGTRSRDEIQALYEFYKCTDCRCKRIAEYFDGSSRLSGCPFQGGCTKA